MSKETPKNFDDMQMSGENSLAQLNIVKQCVENFDRLKKAINKPQVGVETKRKKETNDTV